jgi:hypothetical protein
MKLSNFISMLVPLFVFGVPIGATGKFLSHLYTSCDQAYQTTCSSQLASEILNYLNF